MGGIMNNFLKMEPNNYPDSGFFDTIATMMRERIPRMGEHIKLHNEPDMVSSGGIGSPWLLFRGEFSEDIGIESLLNGDSGVEIVSGNITDYFMGPGLKDLIEHDSKCPSLSSTSFSKDQREASSM